MTVKAELNTTLFLFICKDMNFYAKQPLLTQKNKQIKAKTAKAQ